MVFRKWQKTKRLGNLPKMERRKRKMKPDLIITIVLIVAKMTLFPTMPWVVITLPFLISVGMGFVEGYKQAKKDKLNKNN